MLASTPSEAAGTVGAAAAATGTGGAPVAPIEPVEPDRAGVLDDVLWNLRTWPLELIRWPVDNSHRLDIYYQRVSRFRTH